jgi:hypothetical protein
MFGLIDLQSDSFELDDTDGSRSVVVAFNEHELEFDCVVGDNCVDVDNVCVGVFDGDCGGGDAALNDALAERSPLCTS